MSDSTDDLMTPPPLLRAASELRVLWETACAMLSRRPARRVRGRRPTLVMVIPGFLANDSATARMRAYLAECGFDVHPWGLGVNRGPRGDTLARLARRIRALSRERGQPVQLVGWSLGGVLARIAAHRLRRHVCRVVALGSPLSGDPACTRLGGLFTAICGRSPTHRAMRRLLRSSFSVPVVSIYSRSDGVVGWQASASAPGPCEAIEVDSSHLGLVVNPDVLDVVRRVLARPARTVDDDALPA